jgi:hypothetical protein
MPSKQQVASKDLSARLTQSSTLKMKAAFFS